MEEETNMREASGERELTEAADEEDSLTEACRRGPGWKGWVLAIFAAVILSVTATLLLGGSDAFRSDRPAAAEAGGYGAGRSCCPPADERNP